MRLRQDILFILLLVVSTIALSFILHTILKDDYQTVGWSRDEHLNFYQEQLNSTNNPDIVFFGSSSLMNGVNPTVIHKEFKKNNIPLKTYNLGVNWFGLDIQYTLMKRWIENKQPKAIVIEVPYLLRFQPHPYFDKVSGFDSILLAIKNNPHYAIDSLLSYGIRNFYQKLANNANLPLITNKFNRKDNLGLVHVSLNHDQKQVIQQTISSELAKGQYTFNKNSTLKQSYYDFRYHYHHVFLKEIHNYCRSKKVKLFLLATPKLRINQLPPDLKEKYEALGTLIIPPPKLLQKSELWRDMTHLNDEGAVILSKWLSSKLKL